jgi:glycosyltransferase involved in cell wall biosynthesis
MCMNNVTIITPCFNENHTVIKFLNEVDTILAKMNEYSFTIIVVDDSSTDNTLELLTAFQVKSDNVKLIILNLQYNLGHQGAIYQGILYSRSFECDKFIIMDSDGEDDPNAIAELVSINKSDIIHVVRGKRKENISFKFFYKIYKLIFRSITSRKINFGNYCLINKRLVESTAQTSFIHFAAHLSKQKAKTSTIMYDRRKRTDGVSKMNLTSLIYHAFKSFIEYAEDLLMVFLKLFIIIVLSIIAIVGFVLYEKLFTDNAILGWASTLTIGLTNMAIICLGFFVIGILLLNLIARSASSSRNAIYKVIKS